MIFIPKEKFSIQKNLEKFVKFFREKNLISGKSIFIFEVHFPTTTVCLQKVLLERLAVDILKTENDKKLN